MSRGVEKVDVLSAVWRRASRWERGLECAWHVQGGPDGVESAGPGVREEERSGVMGGVVPVRTGASSRWPRIHWGCWAGQGNYLAARSSSVAVAVTIPRALPGPAVPGVAGGCSARPGELVSEVGQV